MHRAKIQERRYLDAPQPETAVPRREATAGTAAVGDLWRIPLCRRKLIALTVLACSVAVVLYLAITPPRYTAVAQILIDPRDRQIVTKDVNPDTLAADGGVLQVESQARVIESDAVLLGAVRSLDLAHDPDYGLRKTGLVSDLMELLSDSTSEGPADEDRALRALRKHLTVKRADKVFVVDIVVTGSSGRKAARIADAIAEAYLADQSRSRAQASNKASVALTSRLDELRAGATAAADAVERFKVGHDLLGTDKQLISDQQLNDNGNQLDVARARVSELQARADQIDALRRAGGDGSAVPEAIQSSVVTQLRGSLAELVRKQSDMRTRLGDRYPDLIAINAEIRQARQQIEAELDRLARTAHSDLDRARKNERALEDSQSKLKLQTASSDAASVTLQELVRERDARRAIYQSFLARAGETKEQSTIDNTNARIISRAIPPVQPSWPLRALLLLGGPMAGLGIGVASAFLAEYLAPTVLSASHLQSAAGAPVIGTVSRIARRRGRSLWQRRRARSADTEAALGLGLSRLCGPLSGLRRHAKPHTILVSSAQDVARAGSDIAEALVQAGIAGGASTLLIRDRTGRPAREASSLGFFDVLDGGCSIKSALVHDEDTGQHRLSFGRPKGAGTAGPMEKRFDLFLDAAGRTFDLVVFDATGLSDTLQASPVVACVDDVLLVAQRNTTPQKDVAEAAEAIAASSGRPITAALLVERWETA